MRAELASRASKRDRHQYQNGGNRQSDRYFGVDTEAARLQSFGHVADESGDVVGDGRYRQSFDRLLEPQLHTGPSIHGGEQHLVLLLTSDLHPGR